MIRSLRSQAVGERSKAEYGYDTLVLTRVYCGLRWGESAGRNDAVTKSTFCKVLPAGRMARAATAKRRSPDTS